MSELKKKALKGVYWGAVETLGSYFTTFIVFLLLARLLDPKSFGLVALASSIIAFITLLTGSSFNLALLQKKEVEAEHWNSVAVFGLLSSIALNLLAFACSGWLEAVFEEPGLGRVFQSLLLIQIPLVLIAIRSTYLRRNLDFKSLAIRRLSSSLLAGITGVVLALAGGGVWALVAKLVVESVVSYVLLLFITDLKLRFQFSKSHFREILQFSLKETSGEYIGLIHKSFPQLIIGGVLGTPALGVYTVSYRLINIILDLSTVMVSKVSLPVFAKIQDDPDRLRRYFEESTRLSSWALFPCSFGLLVAGPLIVQTVFGSQWLEAIPLMQILSVNCVMFGIHAIYQTLMLSKGLVTLRLMFRLVSTLSTAIVYVIFVNYGLVVLTAVMVVKSAIVVIGYILLTQKASGIKASGILLAVRKPFWGSLLMTIVVYGWLACGITTGNNGFDLLTVVSLGAGIYMLYFLITSKEDLGLAKLVMK